LGQLLSKKHKKVLEESLVVAEYLYAHTPKDSLIHVLAQALEVVIGVGRAEDAAIEEGDQEVLIRRGTPGVHGFFYNIPHTLVTIYDSILKEKGEKAIMAFAKQTVDRHKVELKGYWVLDARAPLSTDQLHEPIPDWARYVVVHCEFLEQACKIVNEGDYGDDCVIADDKGRILWSNFAEGKWEV
jgi:hypothetical protein